MKGRSESSVRLHMKRMHHQQTWCAPSAQAGNWPEISHVTRAALFSDPLFDDYFEIKVKMNRPEYFEGVLSAQAGMMNEGLKRSGQC